jgi:tetratricopeptide (TPR) repeat protein
MKSLIWSAVLCVLVLGSWILFYRAGMEMRDLQQQIEQVENSGDGMEGLGGLKSKYAGIEGERVFSGILLSFLSAGLVGIIFVTQLLPIFAQKLTHAVYDSGAEVEVDPLHDARVLMAQGEWEAAIEAFREGAKQDPYNRMPWVEISKIQRVNMEDPMAAIETLREAIQSQEWEVDDVAYLMFRLAEVYDEDADDRGAAVLIMEQVMEQFPETRHSANARTKLHEWGLA